MPPKPSQTAPMAWDQLLKCQGQQGTFLIQANTSSNRNTYVRTVAINNDHGTEKLAEVVLVHLKHWKRKGFGLEASSIDCI